jgi:Mn-dependent DtxR family transcriptional regulator
VSKLTKTQAAALLDIARGEFFIRMNGGSARRMIQGLRNKGLVSKRAGLPFKLTGEGRDAARRYFESKRHREQGYCCMWCFVGGKLP